MKTLHTVFVTGGTGYMGSRLIPLLAEASLRARLPDCTVLRPWYVTGPGHRWPVILRPAYWLLERIPAPRDTARRLGLVTIAQMLSALVEAVEHPATGTRVLDVAALRAAGRLEG